MSQASRRYWKDMTTAEFGVLDRDRAIAILPLAAIEQHGPHLPVSVDSCINAGIVARAVDLMPGDLPVIVLPGLEIGASSEHLAFPGTLSLSAETVMRYWLDVGISIDRAGIRKLVLFNSHGGNPPAMEIVAHDLRIQRDMLVVAVSWFDFGIPEGLFDEVELKHGIHGGAIETSIMLHLKPDLVRRDLVATFPSLSMDLESRSQFLVQDGRIKFAWMAQDLNPAGVCGDATTATAERGAAVIEHAARSLVQLLEEFDRLPLSTLNRRP
jgi:creatinine amidohydrolase